MSDRVSKSFVYVMGEPIFEIFFVFVCNENDSSCITVMSRLFDRIKTFQLNCVNRNQELSLKIEF